MMVRHTIVCLLLISALFIVGLNCQSQHYHPQCLNSPSYFCGREGCSVWYVSSAKGSEANDGSRSKPWPSLTFVINSRTAGSTLINRWNKQLPYTQAQPKTGTLPVQGGDVIVLLDDGGAHTDNTVKTHINQIPITITKEPFTNPNVSRVSFISSAYFTLACLNITVPNPTKEATLVSISSNEDYGINMNIKIFNNTIYSFPSIEPYRNSSYAINNRGMIGVGENGINNEITGNYIYNVRRGVVNSGLNAYLHRNTINYLMGDAFRVLNNNTLLEYNLVMNSMNVDNNYDHRDGVQMFTKANALNLENITVRNNIFLAGQDSTRPYGAYFQGVTSFNVNITNVTVANNLIVTGHYHGITLYFSKDCRIIGNTLLDQSESAYTIWITTKYGYGGNIIVNNIAETTQFLQGVMVNTGNVFKSMNIADQNKFFVSPSTYDFRPKNITGSLYYSKGVINLNTTNFARKINFAKETETYMKEEIGGMERVAPYDVGCFNNRVTTPSIPPPITTTSSSSPSESSTASSQVSQLLFVIVAALGLLI